MKLQRVYITGLLGIVHADLDLHAPVHLICGRNFQGKSSIADAVRLALCADLGRVSMKNEAAFLINDKGESGGVEVTDADGDSYKVTITKSGTIKDSMKGKHRDTRLLYALDGQRFARLAEKDRRQFLASVLGLDMDHKAVLQNLHARGLEPDRLKKIAPLLLSGFDAAAQDAKERASQARGAWKQTTGEVYGSEKAKTWAAAPVAFNADELAAMQQALATVEASIETVQQNHGRLQALAEAAAAERQEVARLKPIADELVRRRAKHEHDAAELKTWQAKVADAEVAAGTEPRQGLVHDLARATSHLLAAWPVDHDDKTAAADAALKAYAAQYGALPTGDGQGDTELRERLPAWRETLRMLTRAAENAERYANEAQAAADRLASIAANPAPAVDADQLREATEELQALKALRTTRAQAVQTMLAAQTAAGSVQLKTETAAKHHDDVVAWEEIAAALGPAGVQAEMLAAAMAPLNERLHQSTVDLEWPQVVVHSDMRITYGQRPYGLLSVSEAWRADAMLAEAIAYLSGLHLLLLDRMDELDGTGREQLMRWLNVLAETGEVHTALVMATMKSLPSGLPETMATHWVENGHCGVSMAAAA